VEAVQQKITKRKIMERKQTTQWKTKDGVKIRICDMTDRHLLNVMRLLMRQATAYRAKAISAMSRIPEPTAEIAQADFQQAEEELWDSEPEDFLPDIYEKLQIDCSRRKLNDPNYE
jgi:hypothetical protein